MSERNEVPWWRGTIYEVLDDMTDSETYKEDGDLVTLNAAFTPNNGIRVQLLDMGSDDPNWRVFDFTDDQAELLGSALVRWAKARRGEQKIRTDYPDGSYIETIDGVIVTVGVPLV